jgi:DNA-binding CsgD family transcriptional regulator
VRDRGPDRGLAVVGRDRELDALDRLAEALARGESASLVVHGEAGIGKTTILEQFVARQTTAEVKACSGVESEIELAWAALHQLCMSMLQYLPRIPGPQSAALRAAFGMASDGMPDPFLCGLAVLSLLTEAAEQRPVICVIDDAHTLDSVSLKTLGFVSRRLRSESVGMVFAARVPPQDLAGIPDLRVEGLDDADARSLLDTVAPRAPLDPAVRERIVAETAGNPLAIVELAEQGYFRDLAGGFRVPRADSTAGRIEESFLSTARALDPDIQRVLLLAAAEPTGDTTLLRRAAIAGGVELPADGDEAISRLIRFAPSVRFRHPLVRSAIYAAATDADRRAAHGALSAAFAPSDPSEGRIWHLAQSLDGPDEQVGHELERAAAGVQTRGGWAEAAAFLSRAAQLATDPATRARRELETATARFQSGDPDGALELLTTAQARGLDDRLSAHALLLRGQIEFYSTRGGYAPSLLLEAARALLPFDAALARQTYLEALTAAYFAERLAVGETLLSIARAVLAEAPPMDAPRTVDQLLDAEALFGARGAAAATAATRTCTARLLEEWDDAPLSVATTWMAGLMAWETFDDETLIRLADRAGDISRRHGMVMVSAIVANLMCGIKLMTGDLAGGKAMTEEAIAIAEDAGASAPRYPLAVVEAWLGQRERFDELAGPYTRDAYNSQEGVIHTVLRGSSALLHNAHGQYRDALDECRWVIGAGTHVSGFILAFEYAEAAGRAGTAEEVRDAARYIAELTAAADTGWGRGLRALGRALLEDAADPERCFREGIEQFERSAMLPYWARMHLLFGEWLRREGRRQESRTHLRIAYDLLATKGYNGFATRAARELGLTAEKRRRRQPDADDDLTPTELQVAQMAASGLSNRDIAERMYLSHRTVASHLYRVYPKLGITSRNQLHIVLDPSRQSNVAG